MEHEVGVLDVIVAAGESPTFEVVGGSWSPPEKPLQPDERTPPPGQIGRDRHRLERPVLDIHLEMVLEVLADAGEMVDGLDPDRTEMVGVTDPGELEELRRIERTSAQDDFSCRHPFHLATA